MGLIHCVDCGKEVSDRATACPNCSSPINQGTSQQTTAQTRQKSIKKKKGCLPSIIVTVFILGIILIIGNIEEPHEPIGNTTKAEFETWINQEFQKTFKNSAIQVKADDYSQKDISVSLHTENRISALNAEELTTLGVMFSIQWLMQHGINPYNKTSVFCHFTVGTKGTTGQQKYMYFGYSYYNRSKDNIEWHPAK